LFAKGCFATDDSVMTLAVAKAVMDTRKYIQIPKVSRRFFDTLRSLTVTYMQQIGRRYPNCGFGGMFYRWVFSDAPKPYQSFGNGAAMRVSPAGFAARSIENALELAKAVTEVTHDHAEGIKARRQLPPPYIWRGRRAEGRDP
jgi:type I restriction enzyme M protein